MAKPRGKKTFYYKDPVNDDFAGTKIKQVAIDEKYVFVNNGLAYRACAFFLTYFIAIPVLFLVLKIGYGFRTKNRKVLKKVRKSAVFLYGNHTQAADSFVPQAGLARNRKTYILANPDATSIRGLKTIVGMLGALPLPDSHHNFKAGKNFVKALNLLVERKKAIAIYPEAHIWPYYTGVRPFSSKSFVYPVNYNTPVIAMATTYKKRRLSKRPRMVVMLSEPFYPDLSLSKSDAREKLRNEVYEFMVKETSVPSNYAYHEYIIQKKD